MQQETIPFFLNQKMTGKKNVDCASSIPWDRNNNVDEWQRLIPAAAVKSKTLIRILRFDNIIQFIRVSYLLIICFEWPVCITYFL